MPSTPILLSWSGGKDSCLALAALRADPNYDVVALLTTFSASDRSVSGHGIPLALIEAQANALDLPLISVALPPNSTNAVYEAALLDGIARARASRPDLRHIAYGDLFLEDIRAFREGLARRANFQAVFPLWGRDTHTLAGQFIDAGFRARLVAVDTTRLAARFVGHEFDRVLLRELPPSVDPCGERGEFHTFVYDGPIFARPLDTVV